MISNSVKDAWHSISVDSTSFSQQPYPEYNKNFIKLGDLNIKGTFHSKTRSPIEEFFYDDYYVFLYKLPVTNDNSLNSTLKTTFMSTNAMAGTGYYELLDYDAVSKPCNYDILYKTGKPAAGHFINFTLDGENIKTLRKSDSVYSYYAKLNNFFNRL